MAEKRQKKRRKKYSHRFNNFFNKLIFLGYFFCFLDLLIFFLTRVKWRKNFYFKFHHSMLYLLRIEVYNFLIYRACLVLWLLLWLRLKKSSFKKSAFTAVQNKQWSVWLKLWLSWRLKKSSFWCLVTKLFILLFNLWNYFKWYIYIIFLNIVNLIIIII